MKPGGDTEGKVLRLFEAKSGRRHDVPIDRLVIAGFTGRQRSDVEAHVEELRLLGVPVPETTPSFYELDPTLVTAEDQIHVDGPSTSGEVEPVVVNYEGRWLLCVGSDHTDRELERSSIHDSKAACAKVVGTTFVTVDSIEDWDSIRMRSVLDGEQGDYQNGSLAEILPLADILGLATESVGPLGGGSVMFLGTLPVLGGELKPSERFLGELSYTDGDDPLRVSYRVIRSQTKGSDR